MLKITATYSDKEQFDRLSNIQNIELIDARKSIKKANRLKNQYGAKLDPFILVKSSKPLRAFYTEAGDSVNELIKYLNEYDSKCC